MSHTLIKKTKLEKDNDRVRFAFSMWHKRMYEPSYSNIERRIELPQSTLSNWMRGRDMNRERLEKIKSIL